jgi:hypothetical protein
MRFVVALVLCAITIANATGDDWHLPGWGHEGHEITAAIAQNLLGNNANSNVNQLLGGATMESIASWADQVRRDPAYKWSGPLHFINSPDWACNYDRNRDCHSEDGDPMACVDGAIQNYTARVTDGSIGADQNAEALKFLVHFVGDIHQPLHCGFTSDRGGNSIEGTFEGEASNLHHVWDTSILLKRMNENYSGDQDAMAAALTKHVQTDWAPLAQQWTTCNNTAPHGACSDQWGMESVTLACGYAYVDTDGQTHLTDGFELGDGYYLRTSPIVEQQLAKGGVRLAAILNSLFP